MEGLSVIGESINDSVPSTQALFAAGDTGAIVALAKSQAEAGARYIDVNVGSRDPAFMADLVHAIQAVTQTPLAVDTPDPAIAEAGLSAYDRAAAGGAAPILNSISPLRRELLDLYAICPFMPILMVSEREENGVKQPNLSADETFATAIELVRWVGAGRHAIPPDRCIIDVGIAPVGGDSENGLRRVLDSIRLIGSDTSLAGIHMSVGLSNFTVMLPPKRPDGSPVRSALESAFLTMAMPLGLDMVVGSVKRAYRRLPSDHPAMLCLGDVVRMGGFDAITRIIEFYST